MTLGAKPRAISDLIDYEELTLECLKQGPKKRSEIKAFLDAEIAGIIKKDKKKKVDKIYLITERTISRNLENLEKDGTIEKVPKKTRYFLTEDTVRNPRFASKVFSDNVRSKLFPNIQNYDYHNSGTTTETTIPPSNQDTLSIYIKQFSITMGAYLTYLIIEGSNPNNPCIRKNKSNDDRDDDVQNQEDLVMDWINNGFSLREIINQFMLQMPYAGSNQNDLEQMLKRSLDHKHSLDEQTANNLKSAFHHAYPDLSSDIDSALEDTIKEIQKRLEAIKLIKKQNSSHHPS
jgi:hypothetical protein